MLPLEVRFADNGDIDLVAQQVGGEVLNGMRLCNGGSVENVERWRTVIAIRAHVEFRTADDIDQYSWSCCRGNGG